jgi:hypothetical protein
MKTTYDLPPARRGLLARLAAGAVEALFAFLVALLARPR